MTLKSENIVENWNSPQANNPVIEAQEPFKKRAFCIVWDEMKAKMEALGLSEDDILEISYENENHVILEFIDKYFPQIQELRELIKSKYLEEYKKYGEDMTQEETKNNLKNKLSWFRSLDILFSRFPWKLKDVFVKRYWTDFMHLLRNLADLSNNEIEKIAKNYELFIKLWILAWKNNDLFLRYARKLQLPDDENKRNLIIAWWEKLWEDFFYIYENPIIFEIAKNHPEKYIDFCENLKKLAILIWENYKFYTLCFKEISNFVITYPNSWDFLIKSCEMLWKYSLNVMWTWIKFLEVLYSKHQNNFEEILQKTLELWKKIKDGNDVLFMSSWLDFLAKYLEKNGEEQFFEMAKKMVKLSNEYLNEENNWVFYSQKENSLTYWLWFIKKYLFYFPDKYDEIIERVMKLINQSSITKDHMWDRYFLWFHTFIDKKIIKKNPWILDKMLDFYGDIKRAENKNDLISKLIETDFDRKNKESISKTLVWLLQNNQNKIIPFIKILFIVNDLNLKVNLGEILGWETNNEKLENLEKEIKAKLKRKIFFQDNKNKAKYDEIIQEVFSQRIDEKLQWFEKIPESERKRNIKKINKKQLLALFWHGIKHEKYDKNHRTLVLYFRAENMDSFSFSLITHILYKFISSWYSKVFDRILITSRWDWQYPEEIHNIWNIQYQYHDFKNITNIFANTIHFTHGTVVEEYFMNTTTHIIWIANLADNEDKKRVPENWNYIPLYLKYWKTERNYSEEHFEMDRSWNFEDLFDEIIKAVKACEDMMIKQVKQKTS